MRALVPCLLVAIAALVAAPHASAQLEPSKGPPVRVEIVPPPLTDLPTPGETLAMTLRVTSAVNASVANFAITSGRLPTGAAYAWETLSIGVPPGVPVALTAMTPLDVPCEVLANDPEQPMQVTLYYNGQRVTNTFSMIPRYARDGLLRYDALKSMPWTPVTDLPQDRGSYAAPRPAPSPRGPQDPARISTRELAEDAPRDGLSKSTYNMHVHGRFVYTRPDNEVTGVDGATVRVMDEDDDWDDELYVGVTNADGTFNFTFEYDMDESPDVYIELEAANSVVEVEDASVWEWNYTWSSSVQDDTDATEFDYGTFGPGDASLAPALFILSTATRTWRWYRDVNPGYDNIDEVDIQWPEDGVDPSQYTAYWELIEINSAAEWRETTIAHEYNHHWTEHYSDDDIDDYCNDPPRGDADGDCGHIMWCQESDVDAWGEGFGQYVAASVVRDLEPRYGLPPVFAEALAVGRRNVETTYDCQSPWNADDPWLVEGNVAALLLDIDDAENDDNGALPGQDELTMGHDEIVDIADGYEPTTLPEFINTFKALFPTANRMLWATALLNEFDGLDASPPGVVTDLTSPSHAPGLEYPDGTVDLTWTRAYDDMSGVRGYCYSISANAPAAPGYNFDLADVMSFTTEDLGVGTWYFNIRAQDRAERWSTQYASYGPIRIRATFSADVRPWPDAGWAYALVPRPFADATSTNVPAPSALTGDAASTYYSLCIQNIGEDPAPYGWDNTVYVDGVFQNLLALPVNLPYPQYYKWLNRGPATVRGGRHTFSVWTDSDEANCEMNEFDNRFARQWIWTPVTMAATHLYTRAHPPDRYGGAITVPTFYSYNCDGLRTMATSNYYQAVTVRATDDAADYDCRLHPQSTGATSGFAMLSMNGWSSRPAGCIDAVFVRADNAGSSVYDIGIVNMNDHWCDYTAIRNTSATIATGSPVNVTLGTTTYLALRQFELTTAGSTTISLDADPALGPLQMIWLDETFATGDLLDHDGYAMTDTNGHAEIVCLGAGAGWHGLAIYRDPQDIPGGGTPPSVTAVVQIIATPSDILPAAPAGWAYAFVPRNDTAGTATSVPIPSELIGDQSATYFNYAWTNNGLGSAGNHYVRTYVDGVQRTSLLRTSLDPGVTATVNSRAAQAVRGGRHALTMRVDPDGTLPETDDTNNAFGHQWAWTPVELARRVPVSRTAPPDPLGGWADMPLDLNYANWFNCDGVRMPAPAIINQHGYWQAVAIMPGPASDVDPRLHEIVANVRTAFAQPRVMSGWGVGHSDFVLVNYRVTAARGFDVGVVRAEGTEDYTAEAVSSTFLASLPDGIYGPYNLSAQHIVQLLEVELAVGPIAIGIHELAGDVDWGLSLYGADLAFQAKTLAPDRDDWIAWMRQPGEGEWLVLDVPTPGHYCLAIWKAGADDLAKNGQFTLEFEPGVTALPDAPPAPATRLLCAAPNPFNPRTTIAFSVAAPGRIRLEVYDVQGRRVRRLLDETRGPGTGTADWDGRNDRGQVVPSGTYLVRLAAAGVADRKAITLIK